MGIAAGTIEQYQKWGNVPFKKRAIKATINNFIENAIQNGITVSFRGQDLHFDCFTKEDLAVKFRFLGLDGDNAGSYIQEDNTLILGASIRNNAAKLYETEKHEFQHKIQHALVQHMDQYKNSPVHYQYLTILKREIENRHEQTEVFGFKFSGHTYISGKLYGSIGDLVDTGKAPQIEYDIAEGLYHMQLSEREAFAVGVKSVEALNPNRAVEFKDQQEKWRLAFIEYFRLDDMPYEEICSKVDHAKENIILGRQPQNDIDAAFTYKIGAILNAQHSYGLNEYGKKAEQYIKDCEPEITADRLRNSYTVVFSDIRYRQEEVKKTSVSSQTLQERPLDSRTLFPYDKNITESIPKQDFLSDKQRLEKKTQTPTRDER